MPDSSGTDRRRAVWRYYLFAGVLALLGVGIIVALFAPDLAYLTGLVPERYPYACALPEATARGALTSATPQGIRVVVPKIDVDVGVTRGGNPDRALSRGAYHHPDTAAPGEGGNTVIAAHRNRRAFSLLYRLKTGDPVVVYWNGTEYDYRVTRIFSVGPDDTRILEPTPTEQLTLYTCRPRFLGNSRTVVIAEPAKR